MQKHLVRPFLNYLVNRPNFMRTQHLACVTRLYTDEKKSFVEGKRIPVPSPGRSSGDPIIDEATRRWRATNTVDDENFKKLFAQRNKKKSLLQESNRLSGIEDDEEDVVEQLQEELNKRKSNICPYNEETGEVNGPAGPEPTRYGDWERGGRAFDF